MNYNTIDIARALYASNDGGYRSDGYVEPWSLLSTEEQNYWISKSVNFQHFMNNYCKEIS